MNYWHQTQQIKGITVGTINILADLFVFQTSHQYINIIIFVVHFSSCDGDYFDFDFIHLYRGMLHDKKIAFVFVET